MRSPKKAVIARFFRSTKGFLAIILFLIVGCQFDTAGQYTYQQPQEIKDGLKTGSLLEVGLDEKLLGYAVEATQDGKYREIHSILIYKDDKLVFEEYFPGHTYQWEGPKHHAKWVSWEKDMLHAIHSDTKSITSICIGIAIKNGFIQRVDQSIFDYLPDYQHLNTDGKEEITIEHLLTMTSGFDAKEWKFPYSSRQNPIIALWFPPCDDPIECILSQPLANEPGSQFTYYGGNMILLGEIIRNATGKDIDLFSREYLFEPLGVDTLEWAVRFPNGLIEAAGGLKLRPRDMLKVGISQLNEGSWNGIQIVSKEWVDKSSIPYNNNRRIKVPGSDGGRKGYSYSWWTFEFRKSGKRIDGFYAGGWGGQKIIVIPDLNAVIVLTGGTYTSREKSFVLVEKYIIPAFD